MTELVCEACRVADVFELAGACALCGMRLCVDCAGSHWRERHWSADPLTWRLRPIELHRSSERAAKLLVWVLAAVVAYWIVSLAAFAFRHPELTDTERLLRIVDALLWR